MSGGQREGSGGKAVPSGENTTSSCSSYSGSELQSGEFSLPSTSAGPTIDSGAASAAATAGARRSDQGKAGESGKNQNNHAHQQQLKCYGRRKRRNKEGDSRQIVEGHPDDRGEAIEDASSGGEGRLALDLTCELETRLEDRSELTLDSRDGISGGGLSPGSVPSSRPGGSKQSQDVAAMEQEAVGSSIRKSDEGANAIMDDGKTAEEVNEKTESTGSLRVQDREDRRPNGVVIDPKTTSELKSNEEVYRSQLSSQQDGLDIRWAGLKDNVIVKEGANAALSPPARIIGRKDSPGGSLGSFVTDQVTLDGKELAGKGRKRDRTSVDSDPSDTIRLKGLLELPIRRSTTTIAKILGAARNGDMDRKRRKSSGPSSSRFRKTRAQLAKGEDYRAEEDSLDVFEDPWTLALRKMELQKRLELERQHYEESVLAKADEINGKQEVFDSSKKIPLKGKEPARCKTHWDFVLEEMVWLSKDFEKERKWKLSQAKKVALRVSRSKLDVEAKGLRRIKEEEQRTRRVASNIAKDVKKFWMKVEKLVMYKHQLNLEEQRKKALDKHLDFLLGQTERYSTMLAENLADNVASPMPKALPSIPQEGAIVVDKIEVIHREPVVLPDESVLAQATVEGGTDVGDEDFDMNKEEEEEDDETTIAADEALVTEVEKKEELDLLQRESELPLEEILKLYTRDRENSDAADESTDDDSEVSDDDQSDEPVVSLMASVPVRSDLERGPDGGGDEDFDMEKEVEEEDDETTIAADEALITEDEKKEELNMLQRESELPLEELLKLYRRNGESLDVADGPAYHDSEFSDEDQTDDSEASTEDESDKSDDELEEDVIFGNVEDETGLGQENAMARLHFSSTSSELASVWENGTGEMSRQLALADLPEASSHDKVGTDIPMKTSLVTTDSREESESAENDVSKKNSQKSFKSTGLADSGSRRGSRCAEEVVLVEPLLRRSQDLIDDGEYIPATSADGIEEDDETTMEEEERLATAELDDPVAEVDGLKRESEMSVEELLAQYKSMAAADDGSEHSDEYELSDEDEEDFMEDRQDRTSEAGTSGSDEDLEEDESEGDVARNLSEAMDRVGEPSTSGRAEWSVVSSVYGRKLKKSTDSTILFESNGNSSSGERNVLRKSNRKHSSSGLFVSDNGLRGESVNGARISSLLLQADDRLDEDTIAAVAKVSEAAKRRRERAQKRSQREQEKPSIPPSIVEQDVMDGSSDVKSYEMGNASPDRQGLLKHVTDVSLANGKGYLDDHEVDADQSLLLEVQEDPEKSPVREVGSVGDKIVDTEDGKTSKDKLADAAAEAQSAQPTGYTFLTTKVRTKLPFLLKHSLREYQHIGLDWLVTMYEKRLNGILADEMGLGKTIMTISLLAHLACDRGIWGPHLIVVPTSVMLNWETEFMKWCPAFKILTYFGSAKERKVKRQGWSKQNSFHVCITTYRLVIQDAKAFRRKKWKYLILDEAHLIKNWKSQRWQTLLNFNSKRRILLTGTPLQNDLMELWSLMHFLMPHVFQSHQEFRDWFSNPITGMVEGQEQINKEVVDRLHNVLRPFLLRRLKQDVEKQLPGKFEHVIRCRLSKRQRNLYEDFMANSDTQATLASGNFLGLINVLMQLRKVCNHPDLFEGRPIMSAFDMSGLDLHLSSLACSTLHSGPFSGVNLGELNLLFSQLSFEMTAWESEEVANIHTSAPLIEELASTGEDTWDSQGGSNQTGEGQGLIEAVQATLKAKREKERKEKIGALAWLSLLRCHKKPLYGSDLRKCVLVEHPVHDVHKIKANRLRYFEYSSVIADMVQLPLTRLANVRDLVESFVFAIPAARAPPPAAWCSHPTASNVLVPTLTGEVLEKVSTSLEPLRPVVVRRQLFFPDRRLLQFDCGKLQELAILLRRLKSEGHRALIFTQMAKMLDVLEGFISLYGYTYMRLDGSTKPEQRQILMQRFNTNPKIFLFILSTRSGGVGINLVGADTVIFYDSDWNPAMDQQAQDRCHRIGQTREVHIYRLVSESTIEENILKKANQKRALDDLVIQSGSYNTEFFKRLDPMELFSGLKGVKSGGGGKVSGILPSQPSATVETVDHELSSAEVEAALKNAEDEADYMAMKRVEQEEAAEYQEFMEEVLPGNPDEEDLADDLEEGKSTVGKAQADGGGGAMTKDDTADVSNNAPTAEELPQTGTALITADAEEEMDMLADVKQMAAAAAAAGRGSMSFEDQLRPVERYAMRFLELWDPRVDRASEAAQVLFEEKEWELDQLEKLKEEQEAEIDEDNEPLLYESWDTAFANEAYRQQVEVLAQQQENQRQLEWEAMEEEMRDADRAVVEASSAVIGAENFKLKSNLKKFKKAKFKSLKKGSLGSEEPNSVNASGDRDVSYRDSQYDMSSVPPRSPSLRKRKAPRLLEEELSVEEYAKRLKKEHLRNKSSEFDQSLEASDDDTWPEDTDLDSGDAQLKSPTSSGAKRSVGEKVLIMSWPLKKGPIMTLEKERKKDAARMQEHVDPWVSAEDAILCAVVHEYGGNWQLASDALAGIPDGSIYRGCHRHPFHCRERFRQLLALYAFASGGDPSSDRHALNAATSAHVKVTEEHTKRLLEVVLQLPENELLLQRHFGALLTAVRNMIEKRKAGIEKPFVPGKGVTSPKGGDFVSLLKMTQPSASSHPPSSFKAASLKSSGRMQQSVAKALKDAEKVEHRGSSIVKDSLLLQPGNSVDKEIHLEDDKFNILDFLKLDAPGIPSDERADISPLNYEAVSVSFEDLLGLKLPTAPVPPASAVRNYAENNADQRFRTAMNSGWGAGLYEWAAAASSGLGTSSMPRGKVKKRPPPADSNKPPKPKQPRMSSAGKKGPPEKNSPTSPQPASKKKKTPSADSESPAKGAKKLASNVNGAVVSGKKDNLATDKQMSRDVTAEWADSQETTAVADGAAVVKDAKLKTPGSSTPATKSSKGKAVKSKKRPSSPTSSSKKGTKSKSSAQIDSGSNLEGGVTGRLSLKTSPSDDVGVSCPAGASALDGFSSGTDDLVRTGVSVASDVVSDISPRLVPEVGQRILQEEMVSGVPGMDEKQLLGRVTSAGVPQNTGIDPSSALPNLGPKVGGETLATTQSARAQVKAGATAKAEKVSGTPQSRKGDTWVPPAEMLAPIGPLSSLALRPDSVQKLSADMSRAPSSGGSPPSLLHRWAVERNLGEVSGLGPTVGSFPEAGVDSNVYHLDSYDSLMKAGSNHFLLQEETEIELPQMSSLQEIDLGQESFPIPSLTKSVRPRSLDLDTSLHSSSHHSRLNLGGSPGQGREQRSSGGSKPTLRSTSPLQKNQSVVP
ncbi:unnamed protein product [Calypogeia fissa]